MAPRPPTVRLSTLVVEELRALPRNDFGLLGFTAILAILALGAAFATGGPEGFPGLLFFAWVVAPLAVGVLLAARIASARRSRFVDSLYTTPLTQPTWLAAQLVVGAALALALLLACAPFVLVYAAHLGMPASLWALARAGLGIAAFSVAFGALCGVLVGDAGPGAAAGLAGGGVALSFIAFLVQAALDSPPLEGLSEVVIRVCHFSPIALALEAGGADLFPMAPSTWWPAAIGLAAMTLLMLLAAWLAFTRHQAPLGWEPRPGRWVVALLVVTALVVPIATAALPDQATSNERSIRFNAGEHTRLGFVAPGAPLTSDALSPFVTLRDRTLAYGQDNAYDMIVLLVVPPNATIRNLTVTTNGGAAFHVEDGALDLAQPVAEATLTPPGFPGEPPEASGPAFRVPIVIRPVEANALDHAHANLNVTTAFDADGAHFVSHASIALTTNVPGATGQLLAAGLPLPLAFAGAAFARKLSTR